MENARGLSLSGVAVNPRARRIPLGPGNLPGATLFINVLVLRLLTENLQYQRVIKDQAVPGETEAVLMSISHNQASSRNLL